MTGNSVNSTVKNIPHTADLLTTHISCGMTKLLLSIRPGPPLLENTSKEFELNPSVPVTGNTPPTFLLQAENDPVDEVNNSLVYYIALKMAGVPVEMHLYAQGEHAFGLRRTKFPHRVASVGGNMVTNNRDDFEVGTREDDA